MEHQQMIGTVARRICYKNDISKSCEERLHNSVCQSLGKCAIAEKSKEQLEYVLSLNTFNIFLKACPGSGKTEVVGLKAAYEFHAWKRQNCGIAILAFTNNAADVIRERVQQYAGIEKAGYPHFVGTMDSWLHGYLAHPFGHLITGYQGSKDDSKNDKSIRLVDDSVTEGWINNYKCETGYYFLRKDSDKPNFMPLFANMLRYDSENSRWEVKIPKHNEYRADEDYFDSDALRSFRLDKSWLTLDYMRRGFSEVKAKFLRDGFATYHDVEWICYRLLKEKDGFAEKLAQRFPFIIIDECQDLSWIQLEILRILKQAGTILHFVGDLHQAIYEFKKVDPQKVEDFVKCNDFEFQELTDNYRSCQPIVDLCCKLVSSGTIIGKRTLPNRPACLCFVYRHRQELNSLPARFEKYLMDRNGIDIAKSAILARGWTTVYQLKSLGNEHMQNSQTQFAMALHLWNKQNAEVMDEALRYLGRFIASVFFKDNHSTSRRYYCPQTVSSPMRWRLFLSHVLNECVKSDCGINVLAQTWTSWAECVRKHFGQIVTYCLPVLRSALNTNLTTFTKLDGKTFKALRGFGDKNVISTLISQKETPSRLRITTIHSMKGETFDAILLVSSPDKKGSVGGHWVEWLENPQKEHARFAYVASSRPRKLLAWAIPVSSKSTEDLDRMKALGFDIIDIDTASLTEAM